MSSVSAISILITTLIRISTVTISMIIKKMTILKIQHDDIIVNNMHFSSIYDMSFTSNINWKNEVIVTRALHEVSFYVLRKVNYDISKYWWCSDQNEINIDTWRRNWYLDTFSWKIVKNTIHDTRAKKNWKINIYIYIYIYQELVNGYVHIYIYIYI